MTVEQLKPYLAALSIDDREEIIEFLMPLNGYEWGPLPDPELEAELDRRMAEIESGEDPGVPAEQVFAELDAKYGWKRERRL